MSEYLIRPHIKGEEDQIVDLLTHVFQNWPNKDITASSREHWMWKYIDNPNQPCLAYVALNQDRVIGVSHSTAIPVKYLESIQIFALGSDLVVHPDFRRRGLRNKMSNKKYLDLHSKGVNLSYTVTRNPIMIDKYKKVGRLRFPRPITNYVRILDLDKHLKHLPMKNSMIYSTGYSTLGRLQKLDKILRPIPDSNDKIWLTELSSFDTRFDEFWQRVSGKLKFAVSRDNQTLNWKYCDSRNGNHRVIAAKDSEGRILGYVITFVNKLKPEYPIGFIVDLVALSGREEVENLLLKSAVDYFDDIDINTSLALVVQGNPSIRVYRNNGFIDSRFPLNLYINQINRSFNIDGINQIQPHEVLFSYGDIDSLPISF